MKMVEIGDYITFDSNYKEFGDDLIEAKALNDRIRYFLLIEFLQSDIKYNLYAAFTVLWRRLVFVELVLLAMK